MLIILGDSALNLLWSKIFAISVSVLYGTKNRLCSVLLTILILKIIIISSSGHRYNIIMTMTTKWWYGALYTRNRESVCVPTIPIVYRLYKVRKWHNILGGGWSGGGRSLGRLYNVHFFIERVTFNFNCRFRCIYIYIIMLNNNNNNNNNNNYFYYNDNSRYNKRNFGSGDGMAGVRISGDDRVFCIFFFFFNFSFSTRSRSNCVSVYCTRRPVYINRPENEIRRKKANPRIDNTMGEHIYI